MQFKPEVGWVEMIMDEALYEKARMYKMTMPEPYHNLDKQRALAESRLNWQMAIKLIDEKLQHLDDLLRMNFFHGDESGEGHVTVDVTRYFTAASRELERAVRWFQELKAQGL